MKTGTVKEIVAAIKSFDSAVVQLITTKLGSFTKVTIGGTEYFVSGHVGSFRPLIKTIISGEAMKGAEIDVNDAITRELSDDEEYALKLAVMEMARTAEKSLLNLALGK